MQIECFSGFSKRVNSTKQPTGTGTTFDVLLKDGADDINPVFELNTLDFSINRVKAFGRQYWSHVRNLDGHRSEIICKLDYLATYKTQIGAYTGLINYTSSSNKLTITDPRNVPTLRLNTAHTDFLWVSGKGLKADKGTFVLSFLSDQANSSGLVKYVAMDWYALSEFSQLLFTQNIADEIKKQFTNMTDALVSLMWLPVDIDDITGVTTSNFTVGSQAVTLTDSSGKIITNRILNLETGTTILAFPETSYGAGDIRGTYLAKPPYLTSEIYLPYIGIMEFPVDLQAYYNGSVYLKGAIDVFTGDILYTLYMNSEKIASYNGSCATHLPIGSASYNAFGAVGGGLVTVGGVGSAIGHFAGGDVIGGLRSLGVAAGGMATAAKSVSVQTQISGSNSSALGQTQGTQIRVTNILSIPSETNLTAFQAAHGMPYYEVETIGNLSGYIQCADASVSIPGDGDEQAIVNGYLNNGFYYE